MATANSDVTGHALGLLYRGSIPGLGCLDKALEYSTNRPNVLKVAEAPF